MENKKKKISMTSALLVAAMISLIGVGFALEYSGSASTDVEDVSSEFVTVGIAKTGFAGGIYTVNTLNNGTNVALTDLKVDGSAATAYTSGHFTYSSGFTWVTGAPGADGVGVYKASVAGQATLTLTQSADATADNYSLTVANAQAPSINQYGFSLVYTYKVGTGTETVFAADTVPGIDLSSGPVTVVVTAYVVYSTTVPVASIGSISAFALTGDTVTFTVTASDS